MPGKSPKALQARAKFIEATRIDPDKSPWLRRAVKAAERIRKEAPALAIVEVVAGRLAEAIDSWWASVEDSIDDTMPNTAAKDLERLVEAAAVLRGLAQSQQNKIRSRLCRQNRSKGGARVLLGEEYFVRGLDQADTFMRHLSHRERALLAQYFCTEIGMASGDMEHIKERLRGRLRRRSKKSGHA